jgi:HEAT repeat protein
MRSLSVAVCAVLLLSLPACKNPDPKSVEDQIEVLKEAKSTRLKLKAVENLRAIGKKEAVPGLIEVLKDANPEVKAAIAKVLGELKDPSAVQALSDAIDYSIGSGSDKMTQDGNTANKEITRALGDLNDKAAVKPVMKLLKVTKDNYVRIEAITALGRLKDPQAVPLLSDVATDERLETFINKKAILALAEINDPQSLPAYLKMLFAERRGVSFYPESAFGIFKLGGAANDTILSVLKDENKELAEWAKERGVLKPAIYAKAAQIESDLQDRRSIPSLMKLLKYEDDNPAYKLFVRMAAADSLGRMRATEAVGPISAMLDEEEANARSAYMRALVQIGDKTVVGKLVSCSQKGNWSAREFCMLGLALLGGQKEIKSLEGFLAAEPKLFVVECERGDYGDVDCAAEKTKNVEARSKSITAYKKVLETISACNDNKCLESALTNAEPIVRERAAYELGRRKASESVGALIEAVKRPVKDVVDLNPRFAAICAVDWITAGDSAAMAKARPEASALEAQVEKDRDNVLTQKIAEEVKRLAVKLERSGS